ncbi:MAG: RNA polymerase sigma factor [Lachnospiraceae bacterium]|nr:RNA polymerase sigma factor [Lachnospiraceae bacterium]
MQRLLEKLFHSYYKEIYRYLYSLTHDASLSEDLASDVFLEVVKSVASFRGEADMKTWLFSVARHKWIDYLRKKNRRAETEVLSEFVGEERTADRGITVASGPEDRYLEKELLERIHAILEKEPERTRNIVKLRLEGYSFYEIGKLQGISESSARVIYFRAKEKLRQTLEKEGLGYE